MGGVGRSLLALLALASTAGCAPKVRDRGFAPAASTADALHAVAAPRRVALLVGVDRYEDRAIPALRHAGADALALADILRAEVGGFDEVIALTSRETTDRAAVLEALRRLRATLRREDAVVVYFSGHGTQLKDEEGAWRRFLLVADTQAADLRGTSLDLGELQGWFAGLLPARKALLVDACFQGDGKSALGPPIQPGDTAGTLLPRLADLGSGEAHLFATSAGRPSREDDRLGHGVYTHYLLEALSRSFDEADLDRDGVVTAYEAHDHARARTISYTDGVQIPEAAFRVLGDADLILAGDPGRRGAREQALFYLYSGGGRDLLASATITVDGRDRGLFPGTVPIEPGKHHVVLSDPDGRVLMDGQATFRAGRAYRADDLVRVVQGPSRLAGLRAVAMSGRSLPQVLGAGALGPEAWLAFRAARGPLKGVFGELSAAGAVAPGREVTGAGLVTAPRPLGWGGAAVGYQTDLGRVRVRGSWGASGVYVPPSYPDGRPDPSAAEAKAWEAGWWFATTGPAVGLGYALEGPWTVSATWRTQATSLDVWRTGQTRTVPIGAVGLGLEVAY